MFLRMSAKKRCVSNPSLPDSHFECQHFAVYCITLFTSVEQHKPNDLHKYATETPSICLIYRPAFFPTFPLAPAGLSLHFIWRFHTPVIIYVVEFIRCSFLLYCLLIAGRNVDHRYCLRATVVDAIFANVHVYENIHICGGECSMQPKLRVADNSVFTVV